MPLPTPKLDQRQFQSIVDEAKLLIPQYCPEWTDHNVSDPGVTLIELFAWMTDMLLYRVNQVPDKIYLSFLNLLGVRLEQPRAARAAVTFYLSLSATHLGEITIPADTEVATVRTETNEAIVFTTEGDLTIRPAVIAGTFSGGGTPGRSWTPIDLTRLLPGDRVPIFPPTLAPDDSFYVAFEADHSNHVLALIMNWERAGGAGVDPTDPPLEWQVWQGNQTRWVPCVVEHDGTLGFNQPGEIILRTPAMARQEWDGVSAYWLRCQLTAAQAGARPYAVSPDLQKLEVESRGGTTYARNAVTVRNEVLGQSDGRPGQTFRLLHAPVLSRGEDETLIVEPPDGEPQQWCEVRDFAESRPDDRCFTLDDLDGTITLGPSLLQPDGQVYGFGAVPEKGSTLRFTRYQYGGGVVGEVPARALTVLKSSIPYITHTMNWEKAFGGRDAESLENAKLRAPLELRTRTRAVTADDYEHLARHDPGVARARCLTPGAQPGGPGEPAPGHVTVLVLPRAVEEEDGRIPPDQLTLSAELRESVRTYLNERRLLGTTLDVRAPRYQWVSVQTTIRVAEKSSPAMVRERAEEALYRFLNPIRGGADGQGWPFGRDLHVSEIYGLLLRVPGVESVEDVQFSLRDTNGNGAARPVGTRLAMPPDAVICSDQHTVESRR
jgi:predicted phage baseplate assembly protein